MPTTSAYVSFLGASQPPGVVLVVARKTWISHGIRRAKMLKKQVAGPYQFAILQPAARFGDADRWPCGIIFSSAMRCTLRQPSSPGVSASHWDRVVQVVR